MIKMEVRRTAKEGHGKWTADHMIGKEDLMAGQVIVKVAHIPVMEVVHSCVKAVGHNFVKAVDHNFVTEVVHNFVTEVDHNLVTEVVHTIERECLTEDHNSVKVPHMTEKEAQCNLVVVGR